MLKKLFFLMIFFNVYSESKIKTVQEELEAFQAQLSKDFENAILKEYRSITVEHYSHMGGIAKFYHYSGCQRDPEGSPYTAEEANKHTINRLQNILSKINCYGLTSSQTLTELKTLILSIIEKLEQELF